MKKIIIYSAFFISFISCSHKNKDSLLEGKWRNENYKKGSEIELKKGIYKITKWSDDLVNISTGKYFINENDKRKSITLTLVPNVVYSEKDTIMLPCDNIDIIKITDSALIVQKPTLWVREVNNVSTIKNNTEIFKKVVNAKL